MVPRLTKKKSTEEGSEVKCHLDELPLKFTVRDKECQDKLGMMYCLSELNIRPYILQSFVNLHSGLTKKAPTLLYMQSWEDVFFYLDIVKSMLLFGIMLKICLLTPC